MENVKRKLNLFAENVQIIEKEFAWRNALTKRLAAILYAQESRTVDCEARDLGLYPCPPQRCHRHRFCFKVICT